MNPIAANVRLSLVTSASALALLVAGPAFAQSIPEPQPGTQGNMETGAGGDRSGGTPSAVAAGADDGLEEIVVTAQRQAQSLQDVPIAVSAFSAEALERQQIENSSDLQLTLPNITFTKTNFTGASFTIRGIGDLCVGVTCDSATAIHINDMPLLGTRLFETEFFDLERVEVLRGPQGTLFGRNATSGVVNFITAKPNLNSFQASAEAEYGNFDSIKAKGMVNLPLTESFGVRVAGFYLKRDGFTKNLFDNSRIDGRDMYAVRGSVRWEPTDDTTVDFMAYYFREDDDRLRIQKQLCERDPTGVLGCLPNRLGTGVTNANSTLASTLTSREGLSIVLANPAAGAAFGLGSIYGPDAYANFTNPADLRTVNTDFDPTYFTTEQQYMGRIEHDFGAISVQLSGLYQKAEVDSQQDYNLSISNRAGYLPALTALSLTPSLANARNALIPNGPTGILCTSQAEPTGRGTFGGSRVCGATPLDFDRSNQENSGYALEGIVESDLDGMFNFLVGGIYTRGKLDENSYYVNSFALDYFSAIVGGLSSNGAAFLGSPFFRNNTDSFELKSYGVFGETYVDFSDRLKLTLGLRYNNDKKDVRARTTLFFDSGRPATVTNAQGTTTVVGTDVTPVVVPFGAASINNAVNAALLDFDATRAGLQPFQENSVSFDRWTGRAVLDFKITEDNLVYASYSRGYKSGGINPPLSPIFAVPVSFAPESVDSFEVGTKNTFLDGTLRLNLTGFYYKYKGLQLSRIVARTSVNDNVDADIYGLEAEAVLNPSPNWLFNIGASYLNTKVASDKFLSNPRDPSGGRSDVVIIKDVTNASNCAVVPTVAGNAAGTNAFVGAVNTSLGLRVPAAFPAGSGIGATGAFGVCRALATAAAAPPPPLAAAFGVQANGTLPFLIDTAGVAVNIKGNELPQAPNYKVSVGAQYTFEFANGMTLVPRADLAFTGESSGSIFNGPINRVPSYEVLNAQIQLNGMEDRWFVRAFVQNLTDNDAITGLYVTDQSSGLFTNVFTLDPRRYGIAAGVRF